MAFETKDSGQRVEFETGMVRDTNQGKVRYDLAFDGPMFERYAALMTRGAEKYTARNWMLAAGPDELERYRESAARHFMQWYMGNTDEDHAAAVIFNLNGFAHVQAKLERPSRSVEWAAGLFEGEGTITRRSRSGVDVQLSLSGTDHDVIEAFRESVGLGRIYGPYKYGTNKKEFWRWTVNSKADSESVLRMFRPFLFSRRATKADEALAALEARKAQPHYLVSRKGMGGRPTHKEDR